MMRNIQPEDNQKMKKDDSKVAFTPGEFVIYILAPGGGLIDGDIT
jgi:hypothetical protein